MKFKSVLLSLLMFVFFDSMAFQEQSVIKDELIISFAQTANINSLPLVGVVPPTSTK